MPQDHRQWSEQHQVQASLRGMVPDLSDDAGLNFRRAKPGEKPMSHGQRNKIAKMLTRGYSDERVREVISSW